ncbi:MAG: IPT/TIG domain-containing protein [Myxococcaceae bacterium]|nr:IPT/TIG domain-containing protein [Myxococcaceae bacterium]
MTTRHTLSLSLLLFSLIALTGCPRVTVKPDAAVTEEDAGVEVDAGFEEDAGVTADAGATDAGPPPELRVRRLLPPRGSTAGGSTVLIEGSGFLRDFATTGSRAKPLTTVRFGTNTVPDLTIIDDQTMEVRSPPGLPGATGVSVQNPNGRIVCNNCFTYFEDLVVTGFTPREGALEGGTTVTVTGQGFDDEVQVLFGANSATTVTRVSSTELRVTTPRGQAADLVDLVVYNKNGASTQRRGFRYLPRVRVTTVAPLAGPTTGGTVVTLTGSGFTGATEVRFGASPGAALTVTSDSSLTVASPAASAGAVDLTLVTPRGSWTVKRGFSYVDAAGPLAVFAAAPRLVLAGDSVTLVGQGLDAVGLTVTIGGVPAVVGAQTPTTAVVTVPPRGAAPRRSDVIVTAGTSSTLTEGLTWRVAASAVTPANGPVAGGTAVTLTGSAIPADALVSIGALPAANVTVASETRLSAVTPRGAGGAASDVWVREAADLENEVVLVGGFTFDEPLSLGRVQPDRGAIAGGTLVTVLGSGFGEGTVVEFGRFTAKDIKFVSPHLITCRTPRGDVGTVDVKVVRATQNDTLPGGFSYFDPRSISGGLSGGPLVGTLNVTVLDSTPSNYGAPIPLARVMLGTDETTPFQGFTDNRGQLTFSDPSLVKAQTVTVFKENYQSVTVASVNAENLTVFLSFTGAGEGSPGAPPPGVPPSQIAGRVLGFKAPRPLQSHEKLEARVFVAQTSLFAGAPFRGAPSRMGEKWKVTMDGGEYLVFTGAGLRAVYAVLGIVNSANGVFTPLTMGIKRGITTSADNPAVNRDIILDMQLDLTVPITIDSPITFPAELQGFPDEPGNNKVYAWLDLGAEGFVPNPNNWATGTAGTTSVASTMPTLSFPDFPQLDGSNFIFMNESSGASPYPVTYFFRRQPGPMAMGVTIGPMLPPPLIAEPSTSFTGVVSWTTQPGAVADLHNVQILKPTPFGNVNLWNVVLPGAETRVVLPPLAVQKLRTENPGAQLFAVIYSSRSPKFAYNQWTYDSLSGVAWSSFSIALSPAFAP